jgi:hypothetical protein
MFVVENNISRLNVENQLPAIEKTTNQEDPSKNMFSGPATDRKPLTSMAT